MHLVRQGLQLVFIASTSADLKNTRALTVWLRATLFRPTDSARTDRTQSKTSFPPLKNTMQQRRRRRGRSCLGEAHRVDGRPKRLGPLANISRMILAARGFWCLSFWARLRVDGQPQGVKPLAKSRLFSGVSRGAGRRSTETLGSRAREQENRAGPAREALQT